MASGGQRLRRGGSDMANVSSDAGSGGGRAGGGGKQMRLEDLRGTIKTPLAVGRGCFPFSSMFQMFSEFLIS